MSDIILKVPTGKFCTGCMFLDIGYFHRIQKCRLFDTQLRGSFKYGDIDESTIEKADPCPTEEGL